MRGIEADVLPVAEQYHVGAIPWSPLAGGWLSGKFRKGNDTPDTRRSKMRPSAYDTSNQENAAKLDAVEQFALIADEEGLSLIHLAIGVVMQHPAITAPIIGPHTREPRIEARSRRLHVDQLTGATEWVIDRG